MLERLSIEAKRALLVAQTVARDTGDDRIGLTHLVYGLVSGRSPLAERIRSLGLTPELVGARVPALDPEALPEPMDPTEARRLHRELRGRGISSAKAAQLVARIQAQRSFGPVELGPGAARVVEGALRGPGEIGARELWGALLASPPSELTELAAQAGTTLADLRRALG